MQPHARNRDTRCCSDKHPYVFFKNSMVLGLLAERTAEIFGRWAGRGCRARCRRAGGGHHHPCRRAAVRVHRWRQATTQRGRPSRRLGEEPSGQDVGQACKSRMIAVSSSSSSSMARRLDAQAALCRFPVWLTESARSTSAATLAPMDFSAVARSKRVCRFIQKSALVPKK